MTSQLLVEMPAEGAARLLTLSLLEQLPQYASETGSLRPQHASRYAAGYGATVRRLRASLALYADALGDGIPRKARRRLRALQQAAERLYRADVQLAWCARHAPAPGHAESAGMVGDGARASMWLCDRIARRRERARRLLQHAQSDSRALRRIAKRLGVYTTAVRLDSVTTQHSFARLTSDQIVLRTDGSYEDVSLYSDGSSYVDEGDYTSYNGAITFYSTTGDTYQGSVSGNVLTQILNGYTKVFQRQ